jgi:hypothetical protein
MKRLEVRRLVAALKVVCWPRTGSLLPSSGRTRARFDAHGGNPGGKPAVCSRTGIRKAAMSPVLYTEVRRERQEHGTALGRSAGVPPAFWKKGTLRRQRERPGKAGANAVNSLFAGGTPALRPAAGSPRQWSAVSKKCMLSLRLYLPAKCSTSRRTPNGAASNRRAT